jgi:hypothetical protein
MDNTNNIGSRSQKSLLSCERYDDEDDDEEDDDVEKAEKDDNGVNGERQESNDTSNAGLKENQAIHD